MLSNLGAVPTLLTLPQTSYAFQGYLGRQICIVVTGLCVVHFRITTCMKTNFLSLLFQPMDISFPCLWPYGHEMEGTIFCSWEERNVFSYWYLWLIPEPWMISLPMSHCLYYWYHMVTGKIKWKKMFSFSYLSNPVALIKSIMSKEWEGLCCLLC